MNKYYPYERSNSVLRYPDDPLIVYETTQQKIQNNNTLQDISCSVGIVNALSELSTILHFELKKYM